MCLIACSGAVGRSIAKRAPGRRPHAGRQLGDLLARHSSVRDWHAPHLPARNAGPGMRSKVKNKVRSSSQAHSSAMRASSRSVTTNRSSTTPAQAGSVTYSVLDRATGRFVPYSPPRPSAQRRSAARSPSNSSSINWGGDGGFADLPCSALSLEQAVLPVKLLGGSSDGREAIFVVGLPRPKHARVAVAVLGVRLAQFSSGAEQLVSWCSSPYCMGRDDLDLIFPGQDFPQQSGALPWRSAQPRHHTAACLPCRRCCRECAAACRQPAVQTHTCSQVPLPLSDCSRRRVAWH